jgi:hypothetical protein
MVTPNLDLHRTLWEYQIPFERPRRLGHLNATCDRHGLPTPWRFKGQSVFIINPAICENFRKAKETTESHYSLKINFNF